MASTGEMDDKSSTQVVNAMAQYIYPALRLAGALGVVWVASSVSK